MDVHLNESLQQQLQIQSKSTSKHTEIMFMSRRVQSRDLFITYKYSTINTWEINPQKWRVNLTQGSIVEGILSINLKLLQVDELSCAPAGM